MKKIVLLLFSVLPVFIGVYVIQQTLINTFDVDNVEFAQNFYLYISLITLLVISNLIAMHFIKPEYTGFVFLAWSMIKMMFVMGFFVYFAILPEIIISNSVIYHIVVIYFLYLIFEVFFTGFLLKQKTSRV
jgi:hypothetical protein